ncbi:hypothetical protein CPB83DRAFT_857670 [Crepidotus variabilis]|uniref:Uncharacterized protein n=1 Tax=Crepidotus variabilis TaxID=179855 RepID=A0A9P6ECF9_9AGAR|nr:hypothetical protein CPB83DRAFT_857670 [Crepidotus variabilis]
MLAVSMNSSLQSLPSLLTVPTSQGSFLFHTSSKVFALAIIHTLYENCQFGLSFSLLS